MNARWLGLALGALCFGLCAGGAAQAEDTAPIDHWNTGAVTAALQSLKASNIQTIVGEGRPAVMARTPDGLNVGVYARACDAAPPGVDPICHGMEAIIGFDPGARADRKALANRLNHQYALGKFLDEPDGAIRLSRYVVFDGAVTPANLRAELSSLFAIGSLTTQTLWPGAAKR
jgi:hypothetical protein